MFDLSGQHAVVTGAAAGLGFEVARSLAHAGAFVTLMSGQAPGQEGITGAIKAKEKIGGFTTAYRGTGTIPRCIRADLASIDADRPIDVLVLNSALRDRRGFFDFGDEDATRMLTGNVAAPFAGMQVVAKGMKRRGYGRILAITSVAGEIARETDTLYAASKGGLAALVRAAAAALGPHGITVNAVAPGFMATEANAEDVADEGAARWLERRTALGRWGQPDEVAGPALFLCSREASYVTGQTLFVDGGMTTHY